MYFCFVIYHIVLVNKYHQKNAKKFKFGIISNDKDLTCCDHYYAKNAYVLHVYVFCIVI